MIFNTGGWAVRIIRTLFFIFLFLLVSLNIFSFPPVSSGGISIWPGKLTITMPDGYTDEEIQYEIEVSNNNAYDINVTGEIENPSLHHLKENYTFIPDLSWVQITSDIVHIPTNESRFLEVIINIPDSQKSLHYNERWEVWIAVSELIDQSTDAETFIQTELVVKFFIITPYAEKSQIPQFLYFIVIFLIGITTVYILYIKKRSRGISINKNSVFYLKNGKGVNKSNRRK